MQPGEDPIGEPERQDVEEDAERVQGRLLARGHEWRAGEETRVPQHICRAARAQRLDDQRLPGVVLQDQIADQRVVGHTHAKRPGITLPGLKGEKVVDREQRLATQRLRREPQQGQQEQDESDSDVEPTGGFHD
ncbi:MAG: hypothetical protein CVU38_03900 [Chloroflexi bacterium HGW-Chloroflexi-1]|nr:MAG: hypothetical protein CVU38_03900 [Chloroflexi bacterium HGW-Chloroflexi-1]